MEKKISLPRSPRASAGLADFVHQFDSSTPGTPGTPARPGAGSVLDLNELRVRRHGSAAISTETIDSEIAAAKRAKLRIAKESMAQAARSEQLLHASKFSAMPEFESELREKQRIIDQMDADSAKHRTFSSEMERWLFDLKQDEKDRAGRAEAMQRFEDERRIWHEAMQAQIHSMDDEMARKSKHCAAAQAATGASFDNDEEEHLLDEKRSELRKWKDTFDAQMDQSRMRLDTAIEGMLFRQLSSKDTLVERSSIPSSASLRTVTPQLATSVAAAHHRHKGKEKEKD